MPRKLIRFGVPPHTVSGGGFDPDPPEAPRRFLVESPWTMWGKEETFGFAAGQTSGNQFQLVRCDYGRPETWTFFLWFKLLGYGTVQNATYTAKFRLIIGVGRASIDMTDFAQLQAQVVGGAAPPTAFTAATNPQGQIFLNAPAGTVALIDHFTAESISLAATVSASGALVDAASVAVGAAIAPFNTGTDPDQSRQ